MPLLELIIFAKLVKGPLFNIVIFDPGSKDFTMDSQISIANGCLASSLLVSVGAP